VRERAFMDELGRLLTQEKWRAIIDRAITDAIAGDPTARQWVSKHVLGDAPLVWLRLEEDTLAALAELRNERNRSGEDGAGDAGGGPVNGHGQLAIPPPGRPGDDIDGGGDDAGPLADSLTPLPL
jgi:hypothetical protein